MVGFFQATKRKHTSRRRKKDSGIKKFFDVKLNHQGFPIHMCKYVPEEGDFMYHPPGYLDGIPRYMRTEYCTHCKLPSCLYDSNFDEICDISNHMAVREDKQPWEIRLKVKEHLTKMHCKLFKRRYYKKMVPPFCVQEKVDRYEPDDSSDDGISEEEEAEFDAEFNAEVANCKPDDSSDDENEEAELNTPMKQADVDVENPKDVVFAVSEPVVEGGYCSSDEEEYEF